MITNQALISGSKLGSGQEPSNKQRRTFLRGSLTALLAAPLLASPRRVVATQTDAPKDPFLFLLKGLYQPVVNGPDLGLSRAGVNLNDGTYSTTGIYPIHVEGIPCGATEDIAIGNFYVQFAGSLCAYQVPGGALAMQFTCPTTGPGGTFTSSVSDGMGGFYLDGTFELTILEATGIYKSFQGGHNHMVDRLHQLVDGTYNEYCVCIISRR
jgi:hypothetical protein